MVDRRVDNSMSIQRTRINELEWRGPAQQAREEFQRAIDYARSVRQRWKRELEEDGRGPSGMSVDPSGERATALGGRVEIEGVYAQQVAEAFETLFARSETFADMVDQGFRKNYHTVIVRSTFDPDNSFASLGWVGPQKMHLNLTQTFGTKFGILGLVAHECTHAFGELRDGKLGEVGPTQIAVAQIMFEIGLGDGTLLPYGRDIG